MVTARGTETDRVVGLELGADDYVVKPFSGAEVIARIRAVLRRTARAASDRAAPGRAAARRRPRGRPRRAPRAARRRELELSRKEFDLLAELVRNAGRVVTREDLMSRVWDENWFGSTKTLDVHMGWLRRKLGDDAADPRFIHTVRGVGFRFAAPDEEQSRKPPRAAPAGARLRAGAGHRGARGAAGVERRRPRRRRGALAGARPGRRRRGVASPTCSAPRDAARARAARRRPPPQTSAAA